MFHAYGLGNSLTFPLAVGATSILESTRPPTPQLVADIVLSAQPSLFFCIPTFYAALTNSDLADDTFESVRFGVSAAEALPAETYHRFKERFGVTILDGIGSTELLHIFLSNSAERQQPRHQRARDQRLQATNRRRERQRGSRRHTGHAVGQGQLSCNGLLVTKCNDSSHLSRRMDGHR